MTIHTAPLPASLRSAVVQRGYSGVRVTASGASLLSDMYGRVIPPTVQEMRRPLGDSGVRPMGGRIELEKNRKLLPGEWRGERAPGVVDSMVRGDAVCSAVARAWALLLARIPIEVEPAEPKGSEELRVADFIRACLWEYLDGGFGAWNASASAFPVRTPMLWEIVLRADDRAGEAHRIEGPAVVLDSLAPRMAWTVERWVRSPNKVASPQWSILQYPPLGDEDGGGGMAYGKSAWQSVPIHGDKLLRLTYDPTGDDPEGTSILRAGWWPYTLRQSLGPLIGVAARRGAHSIPTARPTPFANPGDRALVAEALRYFSSGAESYLMIPSEGWDLEFPRIETILPDLRATYDAAGRDITVAALCPWLLTGQTGTGSYALIDGQMDPTKLAMESAAADKLRPWNQGASALIRRLVDLNFPGVKHYPSLTLGRMNLGSLSGYLAMVTGAVTAGAVLPDGGMDAWIREQVGAPAMEDTTKEAWLSRIGAKSAGEVVKPPEDSDPDSAPPKGKPPKGSGPEERTDTSEEAEEDGKEIRKDGKASGGKAPPLASSPLLARHFSDSPQTGPKGRALRWEESCVRLSETVGRNLTAKQRGGEIIRGWTQDVAPEYVDAVLEAGDSKGSRKVRPPRKTDLVADLERLYTDSYLAGVAAVGKEFNRLRRSAGLRGKAEDGEITVGKGGDLPTPAKMAGAHPHPHPSRLSVLFPRLMAAMASASSLPSVSGWDGYRAKIREEFYPRHAEFFEMDPGNSGNWRMKAGPDGWKAQNEYWDRYAEAVAGFQAEFPEFADYPVPLPEFLEGPIASVSPGRSVAGVAGTTADAASARLVDVVQTTLQHQTLAGSIPTAEDLAGLRAALLAAVSDLSTAWGEGTAGADVNALFGLGRAQAGETIPLSEEAVYSTLLESNSCGECLERDGELIPLSDLAEWSTPASWCLGGDGCQCLVLILPPV